MHAHPPRVLGVTQQVLQLRGVLLQQRQQHAQQRQQLVGGWRGHLRPCGVRHGHGRSLGGWVGREAPFLWVGGAQATQCGQLNPSRKGSAAGTGTSTHVGNGSAHGGRMDTCAVPGNATRDALCACGVRWCWGGLRGLHPVLLELRRAVL